MRLREHGVDPDAIERVVRKLGLRVIRRGAPADGNYVTDDNVQFSVFRPKAVPPETWEPLLAFAHLSEVPADAPEGTPDPLAEVERQVAQALGSLSSDYRSSSADSAQPIRRSSELTFVPAGDGLEFNPPQRSFFWNEPVHREEFRFRAAARLEGAMARGRLSVYLGRLLIAQVGIVMRVDRNSRGRQDGPLSNESRASRFRRIYACVSRDDRTMVAEFQEYARLLRDTFLLSQFEEDRVQERHDLIASADVFQLYWSRNLLQSADLKREWRHAVSLRRPDFIRCLY